MIFSIVVLYNPDDQVNARIEKLSNSSDKVFVILNQENIFDDFFIKLPNINLVVLGKNFGLAKALNIGIRKCLEYNECEYIALFDQDTLLETDSSIKEIVKIFEKNRQNKIALIGHQSHDIKFNSTVATDIKSLTFVEDNITSGSIIPSKVFNKIGLMDEQLFIDYIDYEWCLRAKHFGYKVCISNNHYILHNLGDKFVEIFKMKKPVHNNPIRVFYIIRNNLILLNRNYVPIKWKIKHFIKLFYRIPAYIFYSNERLIVLKYISRAITDFYKNKKSYKKFSF